MKLAQRRLRQLRTAERLIREGIVKVPPTDAELAKQGIAAAVEQSVASRQRCNDCAQIREKERPRTDPLKIAAPDLHDLYLENSRRIHCPPGEHDGSHCVWRP